MKKWLVKNNMFKAVASLIIFSILIVGISMYLVYDQTWIGPAYIVLAGLAILALNFFGIKTKAVYPDIMFGIIDNGVLIFTTALGGQYAGVAGAVLGGAAGNTLTDAMGGLIEGKMAEKLKKDQVEEIRNPMSTMMGKMIGCLLGAGIGLILVWMISFLFGGFVF